MLLALDLGSKTGWCYGPDRDSLDIHTIELAKPSILRKLGKDLRNYDPRVLSLFSEIVDLDGPIRYIVFEDVTFATTTYQAQLWASLRAAMWLARDQRVNSDNIIMCGVPVGTLKKFATGAGNADKPAMKAAAEREGLDCSKLDDNAVDAFHLWQWGYDNLTTEGTEIDYLQ